MMARGYYERTMLAAYDWKNGELTLRWLFNSEAFFLPQDTVFFGETNVTETNLDLQGTLNIDKNVTFPTIDPLILAKFI